MQLVLETIPLLFVASFYLLSFLSSPNPLRLVTAV